MKGADSSSRLIDFVASNFGGLVPENIFFNIVVAHPSDACSELNFTQMPNFGNKSAVLVTRGRCPFGEKALTVQESGGSLVILVDEADPALQRPGSTHPISGHIAIPTIMLPWDGAQYILKQIGNKGELCTSNAGELSDCGKGVYGNQMEFDLLCSNDSSMSNDWIDIAHTDFADDPEAKRSQVEGLVEKYSGKHDITSWLRRHA